MATKVRDVVSAQCASCKDAVDVEVLSMAGDEIVTVKCKTCGTSQTYRSPVERARMGRRVVHVSGSEPSPRPRSRGPRRVLSSTGREIADSPRMPSAPPPAPPMTPPPPPSTPETLRAAAKMAANAQDLRQRWDALTADRTSRHGRPHRVSDRYRAGEIVLHSAHGMGIIEAIAADGTLRVLFRGGYESLPSQSHVEVAARGS
jgi:hypothetical protein